MALHGVLRIAKLDLISYREETTMLDDISKFNPKKDRVPQ